MAGYETRTGETVEVVLHAFDTAGRYVRPAPSYPGTAVAKFWGPRPSPEPDGSPPYAEVPARWDESQRGYVALVSTAGWEPGQWTARGEVTGMTTAGPARGWSGAVTFTLHP